MHLSEFLEALGLEDCTLAGESYGGWLVAAYAARAAQPGSALRARRPPCDPLRRGRGGPNGSDPAGAPRRRTRRYGARSSSGLPELNPHDAANNPTRERIFAASDLGRGWPDTAALGKITTPTLLLWGEADELVPVRYGRAAAAAILGSQLVVLLGVGHISSIDAPRDFVRILTDFAAGRPVA